MRGRYISEWTICSPQLVLCILAFKRFTLDGWQFNEDGGLPRSRAEWFGEMLIAGNAKDSKKKLGDGPAGTWCAQLLAAAGLDGRGSNKHASRKAAIGSLAITG